VDDERVNRELGASMIRSLGYNVVCAKDGFEALDLSGKQDFSLILMDIRMPRLDGFSTAEAIRDREGNRPPTPIIALSAHITSEDEERCKSVGINDYFQKPLKIKELNEFLKKWLTAQPSHNRL
jgi:CheY-like chemotaxis protein